MAVKGIQTSIWSNRLRTLYLIVLMPLVVVLAIGFSMWWANSFVWDQTVLDSIVNFSTIIIPIVLIWLVISILFHKQIVFKMSGAKEITRKQHPEIYNIVENLCISRGLPVPKIGIMQESGMNAFATGWSPKSSWIVFSSGLLDRLDKNEIEAVAGHELTHIMNSDVKMMLITTIFVGIIGTLGSILMRFIWFGGTSSNDNKGSNRMVLGLVGLALYLVSILILPLIKLAISRKREYLADAGSVKLTKDKYAMINALQKISQDSKLSSIDDEKMAQMCIADPLKLDYGVMSKLKGLFATHPSIEDRISILKQY